MKRNPLNELLRLKINKDNQKRLKNNSNFSVISSNCYGAIMLHDLGIKFNSPFVNLWLKPKDFLKYLNNIKHYMTSDLVFVKEPNINYPVGKLDDIYIYFQHYKNEKEAKQKWEERTKRIDLNNIYILFTDRDGCTYQDLVEFDKLQFKNKIVLTKLKYKDIKSSYYIKGFEDKECIGDCYRYVNPISGKKILDQFDYVEWFNKDIV